MSKTLFVNRPIPSRNKSKWAKRAVKLEIDQGNSYNDLRASIKKIVNEEMKKNGYRRNEDPLVRDLKRLAEKYQTKMS
ncbi:hypothetical protein PB1_10669 [Bacillus methanolicus PB1]|uniref:Uncharacterized protein n=1 Tax=Bacillus methanolicus PB1 TaxID=997296 RepID=I3DUV1_BACMT|nr:hypothetical protein [Bacillus methanolicus]EIJ78022.1 hypothetical protein PB1_10669 [Bacillus methanolicus PB1]